MEALCTRCGRPRTAGKRFCTGCGYQFADQIATPQPAAQRVRARLPRGRYRPTRTSTAIAVAIAGLAVGGWLLTAHLAAHSPSRHPPRVTMTQVAVTHPAALATTQPPPAVMPSSARTAGTVTIAPAAAAQPDAAAVGAFLDQYFGAINHHAYHAYVTLLSPKLQHAMTAADFARGYRTTTDSAEALTGISNAANADLVASVSFTSHQAPASSVNGSACTRWTISLYLASNGTSFLIDQPPSSYHASYTAC
jgi:hypothetical protein